MEIDRRDLLTGLATSTAAAMLPALPAQAILSGVRRFVFLDGPIFSTLTPPPRGVFSAILLRGLWHFDPDDGENWYIRHVATGLTCRRAPQELDPLALQAVSIDNPLEAWPDAGTVAVIGRAARFVALHTSLVHRWRSHAGAIYLRYSACNPRNPVALPNTKGAPALSPTAPPRQFQFPEEDCTDEGAAQLALIAAEFEAAIASDSQDA
jgi:hypothetical protein